MGGERTKKREVKLVSLVLGQPRHISERAERRVRPAGGGPVDGGDAVERLRLVPVVRERDARVRREHLHLLRADLEEPHYHTRIGVIVRGWVNEQDGPTRAAVL